MLRLLIDQDLDQVILRVPNLDVITAHQVGLSNASKSYACRNALESFTVHLFERDWSSAERGFKRALELNPNYGPGYQWYGVSLAARGRTGEAIAEAKRAQEVDPLSLTINAVVGWMFFLARQYDQTIDQEKKTIEMDPNFALAHSYLGMAYEQKGMYEEAIAEFQKASNVSEEALLLGELGHVYAVAGKRSEAREVLNKMQGYRNSVTCLRMEWL